jgi:hypothetical protein
MTYYTKIIPNLLIGAISVVLLLSGTTAHAQPGNALQLLNGCEGFIKDTKVLATGIAIPGRLPFEEVYCWGYLHAIQDISKMMLAGESQPLLGICTPENSTLSQIIRVFVKYGQNHPEALNRDEFEVAIEALQTAFPCRK